MHIGKKIKQVHEVSGLSVTELARRVKTTRQNVYGIFERNSVNTALLERIGKALNYDFFQHFTKTATEPKKYTVMIPVEVSEDKYLQIREIVERK